jgi:DNA-binding NtrC family response regulator
LATVLLVDDEKIVRTLLAIGLRRQGLTVLEASSGRRALTVSGRHRGPIDLLVAELSLPRMSAMELSRKLGGGHPNHKTLLLSRSPHPALLEERARKEGYEVMREPFDMTQLAGEVARILGLTGVRKPPARSESVPKRARSAANSHE